MNRSIYKVEAAIEHIKLHMHIDKLDGCVVLGSGFNEYIKEVEILSSLPFYEIPHFNSTTATGHDNIIYYCKHKNYYLCILSGRVHCYDGHDISDVVLPIRVMIKLGIKFLVLSNAVGLINDKLGNIGDLAIISDHINLSGMNPLMGYNFVGFGPRFPDMSDVYTKKIRKAVTARTSFDLPECVYAMMLGPSYETPAEIKFLETIGADVVGMSTVPEAIVAAHANIPVIGISYFSNYAAGKTDKISDETILSPPKKMIDEFTEVLDIVYNVCDELL